MDKSNKLYISAVKYYNEGYIDRALECCEKSISENINNTSAINLKGLLYYLKGELGNAQALWKMNYQMNKDLVSKKYLEDSESDEEKKHLYKAALKSIKELRIKEALEYLVQCRQSDFNSINVNNYIALCYIKLGEYQKALKAIDLVMKIDRSNKAALNHKKELIHFGVIKKEVNHMILSIAMVIVLAMGTVGSYYLISKKDNVNTENNLVINSQQEAETSSEDGKPDEGATEQKLFTSNEIVSAIEGKDYEKLYSILSAVENSTVSADEKVIIQKAVELLSQGGMEYFYAKGLEAVESKDFNSAIGYFSKGFKYSQGSYKHSHYTYMLGLSYKNAGDIDSAIKYYEQYDKNYPSGDYEQTVLYELALIYKNIDDSTSKSYAKKLVKFYPKSIYNNSIIQGILSR